MLQGAEPRFLVLDSFTAIRFWSPLSGRRRRMASGILLPYPFEWQLENSTLLEIGGVASVSWVIQRKSSSCRRFRLLGVGLAGVLASFCSIISWLLHQLITVARTCNGCDHLQCRPGCSIVNCVSHLFIKSMHRLFELHLFKVDAVSTVWIAFV